MKWCCFSSTQFGKSANACHFIFTRDKLPRLLNNTFPDLRKKGTVATEFRLLAGW
jgi:hypothetical protein